MVNQLYLRSTVDRDFTILIDNRVIQSCLILKDVVSKFFFQCFIFQAFHYFSEDISEVPPPIEVNLSKKQLEAFVAVHNHYSSAKTPNDLRFTIKLFKKYTDAEFKELAWKADIFDSDRFTSTAGDFMIHRLKGMNVADIQKFLNIVDDYSPAERKAMKERPMQFFAGAAGAIQNEPDHDEPQPGPSNDSRYF